VENICLGCGLCCDGTLFSYVELCEADRAEEVARSGLTLHRVDGKLRFPQPCSASQEGCCTVYEKRPQACRDYRCTLRVEYDEGKVSVPSARAFIANAIELRDRIRPQLERLVGPPQPLSIHRLYRLADSKLALADAGIAERRAHAELLLDMGALDVLLARHFRGGALEAPEAAAEAAMK